MNFAYRVLIISTISASLMVLYLNIFCKFETRFQNVNPIPYEDFAINTPGCTIPNLNPFHSSLLSEIKDYSKRRLRCTKKPVFIASNKTLKLNPYFINLKRVKCFYTPILRESEDSIKNGMSQIINVGQDFHVTDEFVMVECYSEKNSMIYQDFFAFINPKIDVEKRCEKVLKPKSQNNQLSVLLLGLDSVSKNSYRRHLKLVDKFIREKLTFIELHGYNKIGENTYPNIVAFYTGKLEFEHNINHTGDDLNNLPLVWQQYAEKGYRTLFAEDCPHVCAFNLEKNGFTNPPTDYYMRPFSIAFQYSDLRNRVPWGCFRDQPESTVIFNWVENFFEKFSSDPLFAHVFLTRLTHDDYNAVAYHDLPVLNFLQSLYEKGHLNRTVVIFFSDHGYRQGKTRKTYVGHLEEKLPLMFMILPKWFSKVYPNLYESMKINERRLVTPLDMHATLIDILMNFEMDRKELSHRNVSLFSPISEFRTCQSVNIDLQYCTCFERQQISVNDKAVIIGAKLLVKYINHLISHLRNLCCKLTLNNVIEASRKEIVIDDSTTESVVNYQITFDVKPSGGIFQGIVLYNNLKNKYDVEKSVDRVNLYGNQSYCVNDVHLKPYCYCQ